MQRVIALLLIIALLGWLATAWPLGSSSDEQALGDWRRTRAGWQRASQWSAAAGARHGVHPAAVAAGLALFSVAAVAGLSNDGRNSPADSAPRSRAD
jgi:hypothetical protein